MIHLGDVTKIKGNEIPLVDIVTYGAPCQDLSVAGKRAGMKSELVGDEDTTRSGLFHDAIRIIREMRNESIRQLSMRGADIDVRSISPRYAIYENVPGALSSNKGEDFRCVLEETAKIADKNAVIPRLEGGAKWSYSGLILGNGWSVAWRLHDAQYHGVPQRRRRLCVLADFNGDTAGKLLFELQRETDVPKPDQIITDIREKSRSEVQPISESVSRDIEQGKAEGQETSRTIGKNLGAAMSFQERAGRPGGGKGLLIQDERTGALATHPQSVCHETVASFYPQMKAESQCYRDDDVSNTLVNGTNPGFHNGIVVKDEPILLESNQNHATVQTDGVSTALPASMGMGGGYVPMITEQQGMAYQAHGTYKESDVVSSCKCRDYKDATDLVVEPIAFEPGAASRVGGHIYKDGKTGTIRADAGDNQQAVVQDVVGALCASGYDKLGTQEATNGLYIIQESWDGTQIAPTLTAKNAGGEQRMPDKDNFNAVISYSIDSYNQTAQEEVQDTLRTNGGGDNSPKVCTTYGLDRASFNQGQNAKFDFSVEEELAPTLVNRGVGGVLTEN